MAKHDHAISILKARLQEAVTGLPDKRKRVDESVGYLLKSKKELWAREATIRNLQAAIRDLGGEV